MEPLPVLQRIVSLAVLVFCIPKVVYFFLSSKSMDARVSAIHLDKIDNAATTIVAFIADVLKTADLP